MGQPEKTATSEGTCNASNRQTDPEFGRKLVCDIEPRDVAKYQRKRIDSGASPKTVNLEIGTLRAILKLSGQWARLQRDVKMLPRREDVGRAISPEEEAALLQACGKSRSLVPFVTLAIETGALRRDPDAAMVERRFREPLPTLGQRQDGIRHGPHHPPKPTRSGRPGLLGDSLPGAGAWALRLSYGALRGRW
jgi:hypothetical protein